MTPSLEADRIHGGINDGLTGDLGDLVGEGGTAAQVHGLASEAPRLGQSIRDQVPDDDDRRPQELRRVGRRQADRSGSRHVDGRAGRHAGGRRAVVAGGEDVRQHREVPDLLEGLIAVGKLEQVEVRERDHHVLGLPADPAAHVDVAVCRARPRRIDVEADTRLAFVAHPAPPAGDVERHRADVARFHEQDVVADFDDLTGDLMAEGLADRRGRPAPDHVLIAAADVRGDDLQDRGVRRLRPDAKPLGDVGRDLQLRVVDRLDNHLSRSLELDDPVRRHDLSSSRADATVRPNPDRGGARSSRPTGRADPIASRSRPLQPGRRRRRSRRCCPRRRSPR